MEKHFDEELTKLKQLVLEMGGYVEDSLNKTIHYCLGLEHVPFSEIIAIEKQLNALHVSIDDTCLKLLARQAPMAKDLRLILAILKMNTDLERMGDQILNIYRNAQQIKPLASFSGINDLPKMANAVKQMVSDALDAFVRTDIVKAHAILAQDDKIDHFKESIQQQSIAFIETNPKLAQQLLEFTFIVHYLERLGDRATNIAEDVIFIATGKDVRHIGTITADTI